MKNSRLTRRKSKNYLSNLQNKIIKAKKYQRRLRLKLVMEKR
jgi:hypothetical protein